MAKNRRSFTKRAKFTLPVFAGITALCSFTGCSLQTQAAKDSDQIKQSVKINTEEKIMKKAYYLDLMETTLSAYSMEHINRYFNQVKKDGLTEHGFPRLTANIGILMAHGKRQDLKDIFIQMMDFCCQQIPKVKAANDFSVKEIIFCLEELENSKVIPAEKMQEWKNLLKTIDPYTCYNIYARDTEHIVYNWAAFTMVSEFMRQKMGLADSYADFIDLQAFSQLRHLDENKMYRDPGEPAVYDFVTRGLFAILLHEGYQGKYKQVWQEALDSSALLTLNLQSVSGEMPFGGRSNQFLHNESHMALMMEYYARRYAQKGDMKTAGKFRMGAIRALQNITGWLEKKPIHHIKNRFPLDTKYGCEDYAYFDKYMITAASFLYVAYRICDDTIPAVERDDHSGVTWKSSDNFHQLYLHAGEYSAQYDYKANYHYDCSGMGRLHKKGAPSELCLSTPCPVGASYVTDLKKPNHLSIAPGVFINGKWNYATAKNVRHTVKSHQGTGKTAKAEIECTFAKGKKVLTNYTLNSKGLEIKISGNDKLRCLLPVFRFNGEERTKVTRKGNVLEVEFGGYVCRYTVVNGTITDLKRPARNRNGHYDTFAAEGKNGLTVLVAIEKR